MANSDDHPSLNNWAVVVGLLMVVKGGGVHDCRENVGVGCVWVRVGWLVGRGARGFKCVCVHVCVRTCVGGGCLR